MLRVGTFLLVEGHLLCNLQTDAHLHIAVTRSKPGKMSLKVYKDQILGPVVKPWLLKDQDYVLKMVTVNMEKLRIGISCKSFK